MRYALVCAAMVAALLAVGCNKQEPAKPATVAPPPPTAGTSSIDSLEPLPPPSGTRTAELPPLPPTKPAVSTTAKPVVVGTAKPVVSGTGKTYVVQAGDMGSFAISRKVYGTDARAKDIQAANPGVDWTKLKIGQVIKLPD